MRRLSELPIRMIDAPQRVTGRLPFASGLRVPGMLHGRILRSTAPHARIGAIDTTRALAVPGVRAVLTGADLAAHPGLDPWYGVVYRDQPVLATGVVRFVGEPVAAVAADDADAAQAAIDLIRVEYEALPAVFEWSAALAAGAPLVHDVRSPASEGRAPGGPVPATSNVCHEFRLRKGDVEAGFAAADAVFDDTFHSPAAQHVPLETHACVASFRDGRLTVWAGHQNPYGLRGQLAGIFGLPQSAVRVVVPTLGGGYGAKGQISVEAIAAALSLRARRPVRIQVSREEEFVTITKHPATIRLRTGVLRDGTIVARQSTCHYDTGAYANIGPRVMRNGGFSTAGPYAIPNVWVDSYAVYTNLPPAGAFRGFGATQAAWAYETQMDLIAERLAIDPLELRMRNLLVDGRTVMTGEPMRDAHFRELLGEAARGIGWDGTGPPKRTGSTVRAKGLGVIIKGTTTPTTSTAIAKLNDDGSLDVLTSSVEMGQGLLTTLAILGGEPLGIGVDRVRVSTPDTDHTPYDFMTASSRSTFSMGNAVQAAVIQVRDQLLGLAADLLEVGAADLEIVDGRVRARGVPDRSLALGDVIRRSRRGNLVGEATFRTEGNLDPQTGQGVGSVHWHQAAGAAEVEVDLETGRVRLLRCDAAVYAGRVINPVTAELQSEGNIAFGVGGALFEELAFDRGQLQNGNLGDYMIASILDMPADIGVNAIEHLAANEIHGIGESALPAIVPAIGNAVARATGVRILGLPITPEKVLAGLRRLAAQRSGGPPGAG
jgi:CO/xanthine dehydrogenase Mo-binding subunit